jgi:hypothetical protein
MTLAPSLGRSAAVGRFRSCVARSAYSDTHSDCDLPVAVHLDPPRAGLGKRETARGSQPIVARQLELLVTPSLRFPALRERPSDLAPVVARVHPCLPSRGTHACLVVVARTPSGVPSRTPFASRERGEPDGCSGHVAPVSSLISLARIWACSPVRAPTSRHNATAGSDPSNCSAADHAKPLSTIHVGLIFNVPMSCVAVNRPAGASLGRCLALSGSSGAINFLTIHFMEGWQSG